MIKRENIKAFGILNFDNRLPSIHHKINLLPKNVSKTKLKNYYSQKDAIGLQNLNIS